MSMQCLRSSLPIAAISLVAVAGACAPADRNAEIGAAIHQIVSAPSHSSADGIDCRAGVAACKEIWTEAQRFYAERAHARAWVQDTDRSTADAALRVVRSAADHGLDPSDYGEADIARAIEAGEEADESLEEPATLAQVDVQITTNLLALGHDVARGRTRPQDVDPRWKPRRKAAGFAAL